MNDDVAEAAPGVRSASVPGAAGAAIRVATVDVTVADDDAAAVFVTPLELVAQMDPSAAGGALLRGARHHRADRHGHHHRGGARGCAHQRRGPGVAHV
ncbi:MAG: hypothetical protein R3A10_08990 [Caldilineaceae bacterium]